ncbi:MAG: hemerythrin domain-containing protein [Planctomycetes bacterium]|nr:hemerythrin domain-containing protein [Planctomycetota bacterium]
MKATEELMNEHEGIRLMLRILEAVSRKAAGGARIPQDDLDGVAEFLSIFVDKCHHGKEEEHLFPALEKAGIPREGGPIGVMLEEHNQGRKITARLKEAIAEYGRPGKDAATNISKIAAEYAIFLNQHIDKENNVLYPMADGLISRAEDARLVKAFENLERERIGPGKHEEFHKMLGRLEKTYLG